MNHNGNGIASNEQFQSTLLISPDYNVVGNGYEIWFDKYTH